MLVIAELIYSPLVALIKLSCLLFYWRVFNPRQALRLTIGGAMCLLLCTYTGLFFANLFQCIPIEKNWDPRVTRGHCVKAKVLPYTSGALNVASDICVLLLPTPAIWALNMKSRQKLRLITIFSLGILYVAPFFERRPRGLTGLVPSLLASSDLQRLLYSILIEIARGMLERSRFGRESLLLYPIGLWNILIGDSSVLEVNVGIICTCLLTFPAFFDRYRVPFMSRLRSYVHILQSTVNSKPRSTGPRYRSTSQSLQPQEAQDKSLPLKESYTELRDANEGIPMPNITSNHLSDQGPHLSHRADLEYEAGDELTYPDEAYRPKYIV